MKRTRFHSQVRGGALACCLLGLLAARVGAQDPFAQPADPFGGGAPAQPGAPGAPSTPTGDQAQTEETDPVVLAIRASNPTTPEELARALFAMMDLGRNDEAKTYLQKLLAAKPSPEKLADVQRRFGTARLIRLHRDAELQPEGGLLAAAVRDASLKVNRDPRRLAGLVAQLKNPSADVRERVLVSLQEAADAAVAPLVSALADPQQADEHATVRWVLTRLGRVAAPPLIGVLQAPDDALRAQVIEPLGRLESREAIKYLVGPALNPQGTPQLRRAAATALVRIVGRAPTAYDARTYLARRTRALIDGELVAKPDSEGMIELWRWDASAKQSLPRRYVARDASMVVASQLARDLYALAPDDPDYQQLFLTTLLTRAKVEFGLDRPLPTGPGTAHAEAARAGTAAVEQVLVDGMRDDLIAAATAAAEILGEIGDESLLQRADGQPGNLAQALEYPDQRLQMAAAEAILKLDPAQPFPGSSFLVDTLGYLLQTAGTPRALVAHPRREQSQTLAGMLAELGYEADTAQSGRRLLALARQNADYEFILLSDTLDGPNYEETIQLLRQSKRPSRLPVGILVGPQVLADVQRWAQRDPLTEAFPWTGTVDGVAYQSQRLLDLAGRHRATHAERLDQAGRALDWVGRLLENRSKYRFYDLQRLHDALSQALYTPQLSVKAAGVLGHLGTPRAQRELVDLASHNALPLAQRQAAAAAFDVAVEQNRLRLTSDEILRQYDRYNDSESFDRDTQKLLGALLDTIEGPAAPVKQELSNNGDS